MDRRLAAALTVTLAAIVIAAGSAVLLTERVTASRHVLYAAGTVLRFPGTPMKEFNVSGTGGKLLGGAEADHSLNFGPVNGSLSCGVQNGSVQYVGGPENLTFDQYLHPGEWWIGEICSSNGANLTVILTIEVLYP